MTGLTGRIFRSIMAAVTGVLLACTLIILGCLYEYVGHIQTDRLKAELDMAAAGVESAGLSYLEGVDPDSNRLTWIAADGSVLYDAEADRNSMENHADREEVKEALASGYGSGERYSKTLLEKTVYCAKRLSDGSVLRISVSRATMAVLAFGMFRPICILLVVAFALSFFLARRLARRIVEPLNDLDPDHPLEDQAYDEISPLLRRISHQKQQIDLQLRELQQRKDEFDQITSCMNEGLVVLDKRGNVLSINPAAARLFHAGGSVIGRDILSVERGAEIRDTIPTALETGHGETTLERDGRVFRIDMSRIESDGETVGLVLLTFDVTDRVNAERSRREFTANVSHVLKTPLTAILGSSDLIQNAMVQAEDMPRFIGHIHDEAARLLALIEDILRLSRLDEGSELPRETVDLGEVAGQTVEQLAAQAAAAEVTMEVKAEDCILESVPRLLQEIIFNLTENAIKYNRPNGRVTVSVTADGVLTVQDNGIGIPPEHRSRVFERFYRVDKSHSKAVGGTGLGLSIVKHAVADLGGHIDLQSEVGRGTTVTVRFPIQNKIDKISGKS